MFVKTFTDFVGSFEITAFAMLKIICLQLYKGNPDYVSFRVGYMLQFITKLFSFNSGLCVACLVRMRDDKLLLHNLIIYSVLEHDFELPSLWDVNRENSCS